MFRTDLMNSIVDDVTFSLRVSPLTLALFADSGWYQVDCSRTRPTQRHGDEVLAAALSVGIVSVHLMAPLLNRMSPSFATTKLLTLFCTGEWPTFKAALRTRLVRLHAIMRNSKRTCRSNFSI